MIAFAIIFVLVGIALATGIAYGAMSLLLHVAFPETRINTQSNGDLYELPTAKTIKRAR